jgi:hypothetical protein
MNPLTQHLQTFNTSVAYINSIVPDPEILTGERKEFYKSVKSLVDSANAILQAKQDHIIWLEQCNEKSKSERTRFLNSRLDKIYAWAQSRGLELELIKYMD